MTPKELFAVGLRLTGVWFAVAAIPNLLALDYFGAATALAGVILFTQADLIAYLCYPKALGKNDFREGPKDFRDS